MRTVMRIMTSPRERLSNSVSVNICICECLLGPSSYISELKSWAIVKIALKSCPLRPLRVQLWCGDEIEINFIPEVELKQNSQRARTSTSSDDEELEEEQLFADEPLAGMDSKTRGGEEGERVVTKTVKYKGLGVVSFKTAEFPGIQIPACGRQSGELWCRHHL